MEKGYSIREASGLLGVKPRTVRHWIYAGKINANKISGTERWVVLESEIRRIRGGKDDHEN